MQLNPNYKIRAALYAITAFGSLLISYLLAKKIIGTLEFQLWSGFVSIVSVMAGLNVTAHNSSDDK